MASIVFFCRPIQNSIKLVTLFAALIYVVVFVLTNFQLFEETDVTLALYCDYFFTSFFVPQFVHFKHCEIANWSPQINQNVFLDFLHTVEIHSSCLHRYPSSCNGLSCDYS